MTLALWVTISINLFEGACAVVFFDTFMQRKSEAHKMAASLLAILMMTINSFVVSFFFRDFSSVPGIALKTAIIVVVMALIGKLFYVGSLAKLAVLSFILYFIFYNADYIGLAVTDQLTGVPNTFFNASISDKLMLSIIYKVGLFILLLLVRLVYSKLPVTKINNNVAVRNPRWFLYLLFPVLCIISVTAFFQVPDPAEHTKPIFIAVSIGWMFMSLVVFFLLQMVDEQEARQKARDIMEQNTDKTIEGLQSVSVANESYHDCQNHLVCIRDYLAGGKNSQAYEYVKNLPFSGVSAPRVKTYNDVVDAIVNQKYWLAQSKAIYISPYLSNLSNLPIDDRDLVSIISNMLDNAIEACEKVEGERVIQAKICREGDELVVSVRNPVAGPVNIVNGLIATSKKNKSAHGYGLMSIQKSLDKYDALYSMDCDGKYFQYSAVIPLA